MNVNHPKCHCSESGQFRGKLQNHAKNPLRSKKSVLKVKKFGHQTSSALLSLDPHGSQGEGIGPRSPLSSAVLMGRDRCQQESILLLGCAVPRGDSTVCGSARARPGAPQVLYRLQGAPPPGGLCRATTLEESTGGGEGGRSSNIARACRRRGRRG